MDQGSTLVDLVNPKFIFKFAEKEYMVKKANIEQVIQYQLRVEELNNDKTRLMSIKELEVLAYSVYIILKEVDGEITEDFVKKNMIGGIDGLELLTKLGFIDPSKLKLVQKVQERLMSGESLQSLLNGLGGPQNKSPDSPLTS